MVFLKEILTKRDNKAKSNNIKRVKIKKILIQQCAINLFTVILF
jgi:hypothetical protein